MTFTGLIGVIASLASMCGLVPQAWKIYKARHARDISGATFAILVTAYSLWTLYGFLLADLPLIITNAFCLVLAAFILAVKLKTRDAEAAVPATTRADSR